MQLHFSPSMRSITISTSNGFIDLMKIKVAARHISYRTLFHTILILAFLLPFVFILTAVVTLEGVNKCSSFGTQKLSIPFFLIAYLIKRYWFVCVNELWHMDLDFLWNVVYTMNMIVLSQDVAAGRQHCRSFCLI